MLIAHWRQVQIRAWSGRSAVPSQQKRMMMMIVDNWRRVVALSISFWMQVAGLVVLIWPEAKFVLTGVDSDPVFFWWVGVLLLVVGITGRLYEQKLSKWREWLRICAIVALVFVLAWLFTSAAHAAPPTEAETLDIAVPFIAQEEGEVLVAYLDIVGVPTICSGSTRGVKLGMKKTRAECRALLRSEVAEFRNKLHGYFTPATLNYRLTPSRDTAYTSTAFNCGIEAIGKSTATKRLNAGDIAGGCEALSWWNKAGGRVIRGLAARRERERALCLKGL
ncbi:lysozyme [Rhizobium halophytocola]|uniref:Lysozyme n=1 Tax=Rhizobium halophytocola TaxID=735519 RepID=A0ABS4DVI9_9HYPH|nr:lysozyme [Rhizobium halophytocola]MBP1849703.1 GH24 family phage-related lysozyme (muramidase) [Rhizobium halophytocola]